MLTDHQKFHLKAVIKESIEDKKETLDVKESLAGAKNVSVSVFDSYRDTVIEEAQKILNSGEWPKDVYQPCDIHDYLEKGSSWQT